ncbi:SRPBCC domain-containing protein [Mucilaginibacter sp. X4EP1]|uniref:SRPBCC domain-containing protein n=1 Tax=Mucilaginibacter sp. X4EP1 TaxID=2723092 RepID=UPI0021679D74|nr:SRPBCC domain-containing protein [Mucilaginibacter sp. X4EP1]MCS3812879.1 uncharacterized protein YndB with AHSA1/START domain [Mucilaginibacter sp. X4EP1]
MQPITVSIEVTASIESVWKIWNKPEDIMNWNNISDKWHTPSAQNDLRPGGKLLFVMGLRDGSFTFNFEGIYDEVRIHESISYTLTDGRRSTISFTGLNPVTIAETFEPNEEDPVTMQRDFCQAVLTSFKRYAEAANGAR